MKKLFSNLLLAVIIFSFLSVLLLPSFAGAQVSTPEPGWKGLVPCGRNEGTEAEKAPCTLCHLIVGFQRLVEYGMYMVVTLALVGMFFAGVMYMVSSGDEGMMTQAKGFLKVSLIGFSVVIGAWLIVNVTMWVLGARGDLDIGIEKWNKFTCDTKSSQGSGGTGGAGGSGNGGGTPLSCASNSPGSCKATCDASTGEITAPQYTCSTGTCCLPAPNSVKCKGVGLACRDVNPGCLSNEDFYSASCTAAGAPDKICCKVGAGANPNGCGLDKKGTCNSCNWLGCWQSYCKGNFSQDKTGTYPCPSGNICCVPNK